MGGRRVELLDGIRRRWKLGADGNSRTRRRGSSSSLGSRLLSLPYASLLTRSLPHRRTRSVHVHRHYLPYSTGHICAYARAHACSHWRTRPTRYLRPPPFIQSHHAFSLAQYLLILLSIYRKCSVSLSPSLLCPLFLTHIYIHIHTYIYSLSLSRTLVTHLPIISQSS